MPWKSFRASKPDLQAGKEPSRSPGRTIEARAVRQIIAAGLLPGGFRQAIGAISRLG